MKSPSVVIPPGPSNPKQLRANFTDYLDGFSPNVGEIIEKFDFRNQLKKLDESDVLGHLITKFLDPDMNLSPQPELDGEGKERLPGLTNHGMSAVYEELLRRFPTPWIMAGDEMPALAAGIEAEVSPITVFSLRARKEFVLREVAEALEDGRDVIELLNRLLLADGYVMTLAFETAGSHAVVQALSGWAREEANKFPRVRRGKGAAPPFEWLKWLAAFRLEEARQAAGMSFSEVQQMLTRHALAHPLREAAPTLPIYSSHGAWSKAIGDARKWLTVLDREPIMFERRVLG